MDNKKIGRQSMQRLNDLKKTSFKQNTNKESKECPENIVSEIQEMTKYFAQIINDYHFEEKVIKEIIRAISIITETIRSETL